MSKKFPVKVLTWQDVINLIQIVVDKINASNWKPDIVIAISRGGYVPARLICDYLLISELVSIQVKHWPMPGEVLEKAYVKYGLNVDLSGKKVLIVDDVADTGLTLKLAKDYVSNLGKNVDVKTCTLHVKPTTQYIPDYWAVKEDVWVWYHYPWSFIVDTVNLVLKIIDELKFLHIRRIVLKELANKQLQSGRTRKKQGSPFWRVLLHSIIRIRPFVMIGCP